MIAIVALSLLFLVHSARWTYQSRHLLFRNPEEIARLNPKKLANAGFATFSLGLALIGVNVLLILHSRYGPQPSSKLGFGFFTFQWVVLMHAMAAGLVEMVAGRTAWKHQREANQPLIVLT